MARFGLYMELAEHIHLEETQQHRKKRKTLRETNIPFDQPDRVFEDSYRLSKNCARKLIAELEPFLKERKRSDSISVETKVLTALSFYASGSYQRSIGDSSHLVIAQPTVSNCIQEVTEALNHPVIQKKYIKFPLTREQRNNIKNEFFEECGIPGVIGCIDGTHVAIIRPTDNEERFFNRKQYHSLNVLIICDSDLNILRVDASHPGATCDSVVWQMHPLHEYLKNCRMQGETLWLLGDSGYPQRQTLMTPMLNTVPGTNEEKYTKMHTSARNCVERCIGILKARFRCLLAARSLHYDPKTAAKIVNACCILHNIAHGARLQAPLLSEQEKEEEKHRQIHRMAAENLISSEGETNFQRLLADPSNRRVNRDLLLGRAERAALISRMCGGTTQHDAVVVGPEEPVDVAAIPAAFDA